MAGEVFQLAILLTLKDAASSGLDRFEAKLRASDKVGKEFLGDFEKLRSGLAKDLAIGGVGVAGLKMLKSGIDAAADYQSVMTDLQATLATTGKDGHADLNALADGMMKAEALAVKLGNALPGTTADFAQELQVLKQNGLDLTTILGGAGEAFAHLAVANNALPKDIAAQGAEFGNLFKLKPEEYVKVADVMSRIYTSHGQTAEDLIEAAKYFQGRAGQSLGLTGLGAAEEQTQFFGLMGMRGNKGSIAGTMTQDFFSEYLRHADKLKELKSQTGIDLKFFDAKGKFAGFDEVFRQMEQFKKLSTEDRASWMQKIFGMRGESAGNVFAEGLDFWKEFKAQQEQVVGMEDKVSMKTATYNNQMEALQGTLTNLKVAVFEPMLPGLTKAIDETNVLVGELQEFAKAHPDLAKYAVEFLGIASATMAAYSGIKLLTTGVSMFKMMSRFSRGEGLLGILTESGKEAQVVQTEITALSAKERAIQQLGGTLQTTSGKAGALTNSIAAAETKTGKLRGSLFSLNNVFKVMLVMETIGFTWDKIDELRQMVNESQKTQTGLSDAGKMQSQAYQMTPPEKRNPRAAATDIFNLLQGGNNEMVVALDRSKQSWTDWYARTFATLTGKGKDAEFPLFHGRRSDAEVMADQSTRPREQQLLKMPMEKMLVDGLFSSGFDRIAKEEAAIRNLRQRAPGLQDPAVMASFRKDVIPSMGISQPKQDWLNEMLQKAFPESFAQSMQQNAAQLQQSTQAFVQSLTSVQQPADQLSQSLLQMPQPIDQAGMAFQNLTAPMDQTRMGLVDLYNAARPTPPAILGLRDSASGATSALDTLTAKIDNWQPNVNFTVAAPAAAPSGTSFVPAHAVGGVVEHSGLAYLHAGNVITPARTTHGLRGFEQLMGWARSMRSHTLHFPSTLAGPAGNAPRADAPISVGLERHLPFVNHPSVPPLSLSVVPSAAAGIPLSFTDNRTLGTTGAAGERSGINSSFLNLAGPTDTPPSALGDLTKSYSQMRSAEPSWKSIDRATGIVSSSDKRDSRSAVNVSISDSSSVHIHGGDKGSSKKIKSEIDAYFASKKKQMYNELTREIARAWDRDSKRG